MAMNDEANVKINVDNSDLKTAEKLAEKQKVALEQNNKLIQEMTINMKAYNRELRATATAASSSAGKMGIAGERTDAFRASVTAFRAEVVSASRSLDSLTRRIGLLSAAASGGGGGFTPIIAGGSGGGSRRPRGRGVAFGEEGILSVIDAQTGINRFPNADLRRVIAQREREALLSAAAMRVQTGHLPARGTGLLDFINTNTVGLGDSDYERIRNQMRQREIVSRIENRHHKTVTMSEALDAQFAGASASSDYQRLRGKYERGESAFYSLPPTNTPPPPVATPDVWKQASARRATLYNTVASGSYRASIGLRSVAMPMIMTGVGTIIGAGALANTYIGSQRAFSTGEPRLVESLRKSGMSDEDAKIRSQQVWRDLRKSTYAGKDWVPASQETMFGIAASGLASGIDAKGILPYSKTIAKLSAFATSQSGKPVSADVVATMSGQILSRTKMEGGNAPGVVGAVDQNIERFGDIVAGLDSKTTGSSQDILEMTRRLSAVGHAAGMSAEQILGLSAGLVDTGLRAEMGGSAMSRLLVKFKEVAEGAEQSKEKIHNLAAVAGMDDKTFKAALKSRPGDVMRNFLVGLGKQENVLTTLDTLGINSTRDQQAALAAAGSSKFRQIYDLPMTVNPGLLEGFTQTLRENPGQRADRMVRRYQDLGVDVGEKIFGALEKAEPLLTSLANGIGNFASFAASSGVSPITGGVLSLAASGAVVGPIAYGGSVLAQGASGVFGAMGAYQTAKGFVGSGVDAAGLATMGPMERFMYNRLNPMYGPALPPSSGPYGAMFGAMGRNAGGAVNLAAAEGNQLARALQFATRELGTFGLALSASLSKGAFGFSGMGPGLLAGAGVAALAVGAGYVGLSALANHENTYSEQTSAYAGNAVDLRDKAAVEQEVSGRQAMLEYLQYRQKGSTKLPTGMRGYSNSYNGIWDAHAKELFARIPDGMKSEIYELGFETANPKTWYGLGEVNSDLVENKITSLEALSRALPVQSAKAINRTNAKRQEAKRNDVTATRAKGVELLNLNEALNNARAQYTENREAIERIINEQQKSGIKLPGMEPTFGGLVSAGNRLVSAKAAKNRQDMVDQKPKTHFTDADIEKAVAAERKRDQADTNREIGKVRLQIKGAVETGRGYANQIKSQQFSREAESYRAAAQESSLRVDLAKTLEERIALQKEAFRLEALAVEAERNSKLATAKTDVERTEINNRARSRRAALKIKEDIETGASNTNQGRSQQFAREAESYRAAAQEPQLRVELAKTLEERIALQKESLRLESLAVEAERQSKLAVAKTRVEQKEINNRAHNRQEGLKIQGDVIDYKGILERKDLEDALAELSDQAGVRDPMEMLKKQINRARGDEGNAFLDEDSRKRAGGKAGVLERALSDMGLKDAVDEAQQRVSLAADPEEAFLWMKRGMPGDGRPALFQTMLDQVKGNPAAEKAVKAAIEGMEKQGRSDVVQYRGQRFMSSSAVSPVPEPDFINQLQSLLDDSSQASIDPDKQRENVMGVIGSLRGASQLSLSLHGGDGIDPRTMVRGLMMGYDKSKKLDSAPGMQSAVEGIQNVMSTVSQNEMERINKLPSSKQASEMRSLMRSLSGIFGGENMPGGIAESLERRRRELKEEANQRDPRVQAFREGGRHAEDSVYGGAQGFLTASLVGKSGMGGKNWLRDAERGLKETIVRGLAESGAQSVVGGVVKPAINELTKGLVGSLKSVFGEMTQANANLIAQIGGLYAAFGRGGSPKKKKGGFIGSALGAIAGSFIPGVGPLTGAAIGGGLGASIADGDYVGAGIGLLTGYGSLAKAGVFSGGGGPGNATGIVNALNSRSAKTPTVNMYIDTFQQARDTQWRFGQADTRMNRAVTVGK